MTEKQINEHLKNGISEIAPNSFDTIWERIESEKKAPIIFPKKWISKTATKWMPAIACLCVVAGMCGGYQYTAKTVSTVVELDVNPSIELSVNKLDKVIGAKALNNDGEEILENLSLEKKKVKEATLCVMDEIVEQGFLTQEKATVLVSVENKSEKKTTKIKEDLSKEIETHLEKNDIEITVLKQTIKEDEISKKLAEEYNISTGKALLVKTLVEENSKLKEEELAKMTVDEIVKEAAKEKMDVGSILEKKNSTENNGKKKEESKDSLVTKTPVSIKSEDFSKEEKKGEAKAQSKEEQKGETKNPSKEEQKGETKNPTKDEQKGEPQNPAEDGKKGEPQNPTEDGKKGEPQNPTEDGKKGEPQNPTEDGKKGEPQNPTEDEKKNEPQDPPQEDRKGERQPGDGRGKR